MTYKDIAVKNEQRLKQENERLKTMLFNAITLLEDMNNADIFEEVHGYLLREIGITEKEYKEIME